MPVDNLFPDMVYQPNTRWSESMKAQFRQQLHAMASTETGDRRWEDVLKESNLYAVAKDPHTQQYSAYAVAHPSCLALSETPIPRYDPYLIKLCTLPDLRAETLERMVGPRLQAVYQEGVRPEIPTRTEVMEVTHPKLLEIKDECLSWTKGLALMGAAVYLSHLSERIPRLHRSLQNLVDSAIMPDGFDKVMESHDLTRIGSILIFGAGAMTFKAIASVARDEKRVRNAPCEPTFRTVENPDYVPDLGLPDLDVA